MLSQQYDNSTVTVLFYLLQLPAYFPACVGIHLACVFTSLKSLLLAAIFLTVCVTSHADQSEHKDVPRQRVKDKSNGLNECLW